MTPNLPQKLWRPMAEVKNYVEKMPDGVRLADIARKVDIFAKLSVKERKQLVDFLGSRESILIVKARKVNGLNGVTILRHKKYGYPQSNDEYQVLKNIKTKVCSKCKSEKGKEDFYVNNTNPDGLQSYCKECVKASTHERSWKIGDDYARRVNSPKSPEECEMTKSTTEAVTPEQLRKQAEELLKAAEVAEKTRSENDVFNKKLNPLKLEICQAAGQMQRKLDEFIDCMDVVNKAVQKLKDLTA